MVQAQGERLFMNDVKKTDLVQIVPVHQETDDQLRAHYRVHEYFRVKD